MLGSASAARPRAAIGRRAAMATVAALFSLAVIAWLLTVRQAMDMRSMVTGVADVGTLMPNNMSAPVFMTMWVTMMVAMMFPTIAPMVLAHRMVVAKRAGGSLASMAFVAGYLVLWTVAGIIPLGLFLAFNNLAPTSTLASSLPRIAGATLLVAGLYQFTPFKAVCLRACRNPFDFITSHDFGAGPLNDFRAGLSHGAFCLGCCWTLMVVLVVVGLMNLAWMAILAVVFLAEKNWRHGVGLARIAGTAVAVLGIVVIAEPGLLQVISTFQPAHVSMGGHM
jgi:predicted metal-binding membrane protein